MVRNQKARTALILNGSPHITNGNTAVLVQECKDSLITNGWKTKQHNLYTMQFRGCAHCDKCKKVMDKPGCILGDDLTPVLDEIVDSHLIIIASPIYCWSVSGCMSAALDRYYSLFKYINGGVSSLIKNKKIMGLFTSGGDTFEGMDLCVEMLKRLCDFGNANYIGGIYTDNCSSSLDLSHRSSINMRIKALIDNIGVERT